MFTKSQHIASCNSGNLDKLWSLPYGKNQDIWKSHIFCYQEYLFVIILATFLPYLLNYLISQFEIFTSITYKLSSIQKLVNEHKNKTQDLNWIDKLTMKQFKWCLIVETYRISQTLPPYDVEVWIIAKPDLSNITCYCNANLYVQIFIEIKKKITFQPQNLFVQKFDCQKYCKTSCQKYCKTRFKIYITRVHSQYQQVL